MEVTATAKHVRMSPRKLRLVARSLGKLKALEAIERLTFVGKKAAEPIQAALQTALADATNTFKLNKEHMMIKTIDIGEGIHLKRWHAVSRGTAHPYKKKMSHIKIILSEVEGKK